MRFLQVYIVAVVVVACSLFPARQNLFCAAQESSKQSGFGFKNNDPLLIDGPLKKISDVQDLFELKTVGTKLAPETVSSYQEAQGSVNQIRSITRGGGGSSSSGNGKWTAYFQGREFFGHVANGGVAAHVLARFPNMRAPDNESEFSLWLEELNSPQRVLTVAVGDNDSFSITLRSSELGYLFRFKQEENGRIVCQEMGDQFVFARSAKSFDEFSKRNPEYVQDRLMRVFEFIGVDRPQTRYSSVGTSQVLQMLRPVNEQRMGQFNALRNAPGAA